MANDLTRTIMAKLSAQHEAQPCCNQTLEGRLSVVEENSLLGLLNVPQQFAPESSDMLKLAEQKTVTLAELAQMQ